MSKNFLFRLDGPGEGGGAISEVIDIQSTKDLDGSSLWYVSQGLLGFFFDRLFFLQSIRAFFRITREKEDLLSSWPQAVGKGKSRVHIR